MDSSAIARPVGVTFTEATIFPGTAAAVPVVGSMLILAAGFVLPFGGAGRVRGNAPFRYVGRISYGWYLWHWPLLILAGVIASGASGGASDPEGGAPVTPALFADLQRILPNGTGAYSSSTVVGRRSAASLTVFAFLGLAFDIHPRL